MTGSTSAAQVVEALIAYWRTDALTAALDLGIFTALGTRARTPSELAAICGALPSTLQPLCDYLAAEGFLSTRRGRYRSTATARRFLNGASPDALTEATRFFNGRTLRRCFAALSRTVRGGTPAMSAAARRQLWIDFARSTFLLRRLDAVATASELRRGGIVRGRILDLGGGASPLGLELLQRAPATTLVVQDSRAVVNVAMRQARRSGLGDRVTSFVGHAERVIAPGPFDVVLLVNVLDYVDRTARQRVLRNVRNALRPGGVLVVRAPTLRASRRPPREAVEHGLLVLALTGMGAMTVAETSHLLRGAGFAALSRSSRLALIVARRRR